MGDDIKINKEKTVVPAGSSFLPEEIRDVDGHVEVYSIEEEFARTKKNKNYKLYFFILLFVTAILGFAYAFTYYLGEKGRDVPLDIQEFEDLRLKEVLQSTRFYENRIELISMKIQTMRIKMLNEILNLRKKSLGEELDVIAAGIPSEEKETKLKELRDREWRYLRWTRARYRYRIRREERNLRKLETQMRKEREIIQQKKKQGLVTNEDRLNSLKMKNLRNSRRSGMYTMQQYHDSYVRYLILKYNPVFRSEKLKEILSGAAGKDSREKLSLRKYHTILNEKAGFGEDRFKNLRGDIEKDFLLIERLKSIPSVNSVAPSLKAIDSLSRKIINEYEVLWGSLSTLVDVYHYAVKKHLEKSKISQGIILDARKEERVVVQLVNREKVKVGTPATVIRGAEQKYIATIEFTSLDRIPVAKVLEKKEALQPFDDIVLVEAKANEKIK